MIPYTYEVIESTPKGLTLRYMSPGREPVVVGAHAPAENESLDAIAFQYSPVPLWIANDREGVVVPVGTTGAYTPPTPEPVTLETVKRDKLAALADWRYRKETGGVSVAGVRIDTQRDSQAIIGNTLLSMREGLVQSVNWKTATGQFVTLDLTQMIGIAGAVAAHVQACFTAEGTLADEIAACTTIEQVQAIEFPDEILSGAA